MAEFYNGEELNYVNLDRLEKTLKFVPNRRQSFVSTGELVNAIGDAGVQPKDITGIYKVSHNNPSFSVQFGFSVTCDMVYALSQLKVRDTIFEIMRLNEQIVNLRVHWLPLYFDKMILTEIFENFGEVLDVSMLKTAYAHHTTFDGVREVRLKTEELKKTNKRFHM